MKSRKVWTDEQEEELIHLYTTVTRDIDKICDILGKKKRSVISKLVQLKIYIKPEIESSPKITIKSLLRDLENLLEINLEGMNLSKKDNLIILVNAIREKLKNKEK